MEYYLAIKINDVLKQDTTWMNLENILNKRSQLQNPIYCMIPFVWNVQYRQIYRESILVVA